LRVKALRIVAALSSVLALALGLRWAATAPASLPAGTTSAERLAAGPFAIDRIETTWVDESRPTAENGSYAGAPDRTFAVALWVPVAAPGAHPLVVYSHGFMSSRHGGRYLAEHLASHGYVVVATDHPLSNLGAPGGPNALDVLNQPADVSFLIDRVLALEGDSRPFEGEIDTSRIGVFGLSLGGLTTTLAAFHPDLRDPRLAAAISIAGPGAMFEAAYFDHAEVPFLMIAGSADSMIDYEANARPIPDRVRDAGLVTIAGGTHAGFDQMAVGAMRLLGNPDSLGCMALMANLEFDGGANPFESLGTPEQGISDPLESPLPCEKEFDAAMRAGLQHQLTTLAVRAFFESRFATDPAERAAHARFLTEIFPAEVAEVTYTASTRS
jgi:predicted dienelactone hydrolase